MPDLRRLGRYLQRALHLRCPLCGDTPVFRPVAEVHRLDDWFTPLPGCSRCGYPYEREPGYYLLAVWGINYFVAAFLGLSLYALVRILLDLSTTATLLIVLPPVGLVSVLLVRHAKAVFLAIDRYIDPQG